MTPGNYAPATLAIMQAFLRAFLDSCGPATKPEIQSGLNWYKRKTEYVLSSQPTWLVAVGTIKVKCGKLVLYHSQGEHILGTCTQCGRKNFHPCFRATCHRCIIKGPKAPECSRVIPGVDVSKPTEANPGGELKQLILGARWDAGLPLHLPGDLYQRVNPDWNESQEEPNED